MKKNEIILFLTLGILIMTPLSKVKAEEKTIGTIAPSVKTQTQNNIKGSVEEKALLDAINSKIKIEASISKDIQTKKALIEKKIKDNKTEKKILLSIKAQEKVKNTLKKISDKLNNQLVKLSEVDAKLLLKINTAEKEGKIVSSIKDQYTIAETSLKKTKGEVFNAIIIATDQLKTKTSKETIRDLVKTAEESIKTTGNEYRKLLPLLAQIEGDNSIKN